MAEGGGGQDTLFGKSSTSQLQTEHKTWLPGPLYSLAGAEGECNPYDACQEVVRTVHFSDYTDAHGGLVSNCLTESSHSHLIEKLSEVKGFWFGSYKQEGRYWQNWYGNVNFIINLNSFLLKWKKYKVYFMEVLDYRSSNVSRLLLTSRDDLELPEYDPRSWGGPWYQDNEGANFFLRDARRFGKEGYNKYPHVVELFFVLSEEECETVLGMSRKEAANHEDANCDFSRNCKKYRSGMNRSNWQTCPSPWSIEHTEMELEKFG